jgi:hypothetical protein
MSELAGEQFLIYRTDQWVIAMGLQAGQPFAQRITYTFTRADQVMSGQGQLSYDGVSWDDDLRITCRSAS